MGMLLSASGHSASINTHELIATNFHQSYDKITFAMRLGATYKLQCFLERSKAKHSAFP